MPNVVLPDGVLFQRPPGAAEALVVVTNSVECQPCGDLGIGLRVGLLDTAVFVLAALPPGSARGGRFSDQSRGRPGVRGDRRRPVSYRPRWRGAGLLCAYELHRLRDRGTRLVPGRTTCRGGASRRSARAFAFRAGHEHVGWPDMERCVGGADRCSRACRECADLLRLGRPTRTVFRTEDSGRNWAMAPGGLQESDDGGFSFLPARGAPAGLVAIGASPAGPDENQNHLVPVDRVGATWVRTFQGWRARSSVPGSTNRADGRRRRPLPPRHVRVLAVLRRRRPHLAPHPRATGMAPIRVGLPVVLQHRARLLPPRLSRTRPPLQPRTDRTGAPPCPGRNADSRKHRK